jgi:triosephosphate isomerase
MRAPDGSGVPFLVAVNLKSYFSVADTVSWAAEVAELAAADDTVHDGRARLVVLPSFVALPACVRAVGGLLDVGAQDIGASGRGAYTGEVCGGDLVELGCRYALVGHRERRSQQGETDAVVRAKTAAAVACEPVWAIGAPGPADAAHVAAVCSALRGWLVEQNLRTRARIIYGGAAGPGLLGELGADVDGLFLGRQVHDPRVLTQVLDEVRILTSESQRARGCDV